MDSLRQLAAKIAKQLGGLSLSARLAVLTAGALVAVSVIWMIYWAATPEMVPLLDQDLEPSELAQVRDGLELMNERFQLVGHKVMVRADASRQAILAHLQQHGQLPADTSVGFNALVEEANPWISQAEHERHWTVALKNELEMVLRSFDGVRSASVFLPMTSGRERFARNAPAATASITFVMEGGQPVTRELALAAARMVAGAVRGLPLKNVEVVDANGVSALDWDAESAPISSLDRKRRAEERAIQQKIASQLADPKSRVAVQVELELTDLSVESETPSEPVEVETETTSEETSRAASSAEPGVKPNVGVVAGAQPAGESTTKDTSKSKSVPAMTVKREATPPGGIKEVWAAINISHSFLETVFRRSNPDTETVPDEEIQKVFDREKARIVSQVTKLVKPQDADHVAVDWYYDTAADLEPVAAASTMDEAFNLVRQYGPQSGLALLALMSLGLMLRMARKSDASEAFGLEIGLPKEAIEAAQRAAKDVSAAIAASGPGVPTKSSSSSSAAEVETVFDVGFQSIGQAAATEGVLVAQEVDEKTVQTHKMLDQVAEVVSNDPEASSALFEQWIQRSDSFGG